VTQAPCDGRFCVAPDRLAHSALGAADNLTGTGNVLLYGFTNANAESLIPLARSWNKPPALTKLKGGASEGYDKAQRAYLVTTDGDELSFTLKASKKAPIVNPCFVLKNWDKQVQVQLDGDNKLVRQGLVRDTDGNLQLVVWIQFNSTNTTSIALKKI